MSFEAIESYRKLIPLTPRMASLGEKADTSFAKIKYQYRLRTVTMKTLYYRILLRKEEDGTYTVIVPSLPGCLTFGRTVEEAMEMAKEAIEGFIACMIERGEEVPVEDSNSVVCTIAVEANA